MWLLLHTPTITSLILAAACGLGSSLIPYASDMIALRWIPAEMFGTFTSLNLVWAALAGWLLLSQELQPNEWIGIALIILSSAVVSARAASRSSTTPIAAPTE
ncbi:MAG: hypothetical protein BGN97_13180 [Microbacterium sp. 69-10]|nr:MAG: hypothetical protein BGN97_13180 [Microbacterium sp. 69-10]